MQTLIAIPETELKRLYRRAGEKYPFSIKDYEVKDEWVTLAVLKQRTGKTNQQARYIRKLYPELTKVKEGKQLTRDCYLYNITQIIEKSI